MAEMLDAAAQSTKVMSLLLGAVASVSLLVGGIGIMNIMLVSVTERTREIGIRMAIGARGSDIRTQFLMEALLLSRGGGIIGIVLGTSASKIITGILGWATVVSTGSIVLAFGFSVFVGIFFGFYPAWKAPPSSTPSKPAIHPNRRNRNRKELPSHRRGAPSSWPISSAGGLLFPARREKPAARGASSGQRSEGSAGRAAVPPYRTGPVWGR